MEVRSNVPCILVSKGALGLELTGLVIQRHLGLSSRKSESQKPLWLVVWACRCSSRTQSRPIRPKPEPRHRNRRGLDGVVVVRFLDFGHLEIDGCLGFLVG